VNPTDTPTVTPSTTPTMAPTAKPTPSPHSPTTTTMNDHAQQLTLPVSGPRRLTRGKKVVRFDPRTTLEDMGHPQPATPIQADNACAVGLANGTVKQKRSKAIDMRFYWVRDQVKQGHFVIYWRKGSENDADYFTKHHSPSHHRRMRSRYLLDS